jgi:hypothetical protein
MVAAGVAAVTTGIILWATAPKERAVRAVAVPTRTRGSR